MFAASCCSETNSLVSKPKQGRHYGPSIKTSFAMILWIACTWSFRTPDGRTVKSAEFAWTSSNPSLWLLLSSRVALLWCLVFSLGVQILGASAIEPFLAAHLPHSPLCLPHSHPTPDPHFMASSLALKMGNDLISQSLLRFQRLIVLPFGSVCFTGECLGDKTLPKV